MKLKVRYNTLILLVLFFSAGFPFTSFALNDKEHAVALFKQGNEHFEKGRYERAIAAYRTIADSGYHSASVYFNLGNACYRAGDIPSAILYYEKARKLDPGNEDIRTNIRIANLKTTDKTDAVPELFLFRWWRGFILLFPLNTLAVLSVSVIILSAAVLVVYLLAGSVRLKKAAFYTGCLLLFSGLLFLFMANRQSNYFKTNREAVIFSGSVDVKSEPGIGSKTLFVIHDGTKVSVHDKSNGWMKIGLPNGNTGWIPADDAKEI